jgi:hypothetical protein
MQVHREHPSWSTIVRPSLWELAKLSSTNIPPGLLRRQSGSERSSKEGVPMDKVKKTLAAWKPLFYSMAATASMLLAAGAKWRPKA